MFVRETSANGKISFWTIHPEANRYLTLDQVFKVSPSQVLLPQFSGGSLSLGGLSVGTFCTANDRINY